jgi:NAD(P)H-dependent flavin oxidoreductase YrpB (nitropropane dioxygenase family)
MFHTALTKLVGSKYPIIGGTMMHISRAPWVAALSNAGVLGMLASAIYLDESEFRDDLRRLKDLTDQPFGVNINLFPTTRKLDNMRYLDLMAEERIRIVETSGQAPPENLVARIKSYGMTWMHKCVGVRYARKAEQLGADAVTVVGYENGGATGTLNVATLVLVPATVDAVRIPVIGGGGVVDGRTFLAVMSLGASGVIMGTRLLFCPECPIHDKLKRALLEATELDTDVVMRSLGFGYRLWMNEPAKKIADLEAHGAGLEEIYPYASGEASQKMFTTGDVSAGTVSCSQAVGLVKEIKPLREIIAEVIEDATRRQQALATDQ